MRLLLLLIGCLGRLEARLLRGQYPDLAGPVDYPAPGSVCDVTTWGATGDGQTDDTEPIQRAIRECPRDGQGKFGVLLPVGRRFVTGALNLSTGCRLTIDGVLLGSTDPAKYPVVPPLAGYGPGQRDAAVHGWGRHMALLSGWRMTDVVVAGSGMIDGQGDRMDRRLGSSWMSRFTAYRRCAPHGCAGLPAAGLLQFGRPRVWEPMFSKEVALLNLTIVNQAFWAVHPYGCDDIHIADINITAPRDEGIANDDGLDPDSSSNVLIERSWVSVGDNSAAIKSGMDLAGRKFGMPAFNIVWRDTVFVSETFAIGSEMSGGVFNITIDGCTFGTDGSDFAGFHIKAPRPRGGSVHAIRVLNSAFWMQTSVKQPMPISASMFYGTGSPPVTNRSATPHVFDVLFRNISIFMPQSPISKSEPSFQFLGLPDAPMSDFVFQDVTVKSGRAMGWQCVNTSAFSFERVSPAPDMHSGCI